MSFLPSFFNTVIGISHIYLFWSLRRAFGGGWWQYCAAAVLVLAYASVLLRSTIAQTRHGPYLAGGVMLWVGFMLIATMWLGGRDVAHLAAWLCDWQWGTDWARFLNVSRTIPAALLLSLAAFAYSLYEARTPMVTRLSATDVELPEGREKIRIVAFSDMHLLRITSPERVAELVDRINRQEPDILLALGDTVDDYLADQDWMADALGRLKGPLGKFAVIGNHEYNRGLDQAIVFLEKSGFTLLRGQSVVFGGMRIVGVDDPRVPGRVGIADALRQASREEFVLLAAHRPETPEDARGLFDMQLSGHTHGGQIWPLRYLAWLVHGYRHRQGITLLQPVPRGLGDEEGRRSVLYLTNGIGYWGPPIRFLTPPEIVVIDIYCARHEIVKMGGGGCPISL